MEIDNRISLWLTRPVLTSRFHALGEILPLSCFDRCSSAVWVQYLKEQEDSRHPGDSSVVFEVKMATEKIMELAGLGWACLLFQNLKNTFFLVDKSKMITVEKSKV